VCVVDFGLVGRTRQRASDRRSWFAGSFAGVLFPRSISRADGSPTHSFVNTWPLGFPEHSVGDAGGRAQARGLHGLLLAIVPVQKAALIRLTCGDQPHQVPHRAGLRTGDSNDLEPELSSASTCSRRVGSPGVFRVFVVSLQACSRFISHQRLIPLPWPRHTVFRRAGG
jgi:hypothetical protein